MSGPRVLFAVFGSAGDVLPSIAVAGALQEAGCEVALAGPRSAGLYARAAGIGSIAIGDGREVGVLRDEQIYTTRFGGFSSWRRTLDHYLAPLLEADQERLRSAVATWAPDVVVVHPLATFGSLVAAELGVPWVSLHLYPQLVPAEGAPLGRGRYARRYAAAVEHVERSAGLARRMRPLQAWGWSEVANLSVHDPALVERSTLAGRRLGEPLGFPYWDSLPARADDVDRATAALGDPGVPGVVLTLGSFVGRARQEVWRRLGVAARELGAACVAVGVPEPVRGELERDHGVVCTGFVPSSTLFPLADAVVHHGGIGTMYAGLLAGKRCGVVPQAFDQSFNGELLDGSGLGRVLQLDGDLRAGLRGLVAGEAHEPVAALAPALVRPHAAAAAIAARILDVVGAAAEAVR
jgi:UDP:flavonoid glycosyltransferase YjiC (YdhE family)